MEVLRPIEDISSLDVNEESVKEIKQAFVQQMGTEKDYEDHLFC